MSSAKRKPLGAAKRIEEKPEVEEAEEVKAVEEAEEVKAKPEVVYVVIEGRATTSLKGIIPAGVPLKPEFFSGGQITLNAMIKSGLAVPQKVE